MKRIVSLLVSAILALTAIAPAVYAENTEEMENVLTSVKERIAIPDEYSEFSSSKETMYGQTAYSFEWSKTEEYGRIIVDCCADGTITSYGIYDLSYSDEAKIPAISKSDAKKTAEDFVSNINPDFPHEMRFEEIDYSSLYGDGYTFYINIYVNGIRTDGSGMINVNGETGEVGSFSMSYTPVEYASLNNVIDVETAKRAYSEKLGLELVYRSYINDDDEKVIYPVYVQRYEFGKYINALNGEVYVEPEFADYAANGKGYAGVASESDMFTEAEKTEILAINGLISKDEAESKIRNNKLLNVPKDMKTTYSELSCDGFYDKYYYSISMCSDDGGIYARIDAQTGEIVNYSRYTDTDEEYTNRNDETFKALAGDKADEYTYNEESQDYERYVNGIVVENDSAAVRYAGNTLVYYRIAYTEGDFPSLDGVMSKEDAESIMFKKDGYDMMYKCIVENEKMKAVPVYVHKVVNINPFTGVYVDYDNEEIIEGAGEIEYSDIKGHYAENYINTLADFEIGFDDDEFKPDEKITQKDFLALLMAIRRNGIIVMKDNVSQADYIYNLSVSDSIISDDERNDNAVVTREMASMYMIRAMGAEKYAQYEDIYVPIFDDVTQNKGYIALLNAMGIVSGDGDGKFNPDREITRAESAVMIYNYLTR